MPDYRSWSGIFQDLFHRGCGGVASVGRGLRWPAGFAVSVLLLKYGGGRCPITDLGRESFKIFSTVGAVALPLSAGGCGGRRGLPFPCFYLNTVAVDARLPILVGNLSRSFPPWVRWRCLCRPGVAVAGGVCRFRAST